MRRSATRLTRPCGSVSPAYRKPHTRLQHHGALTGGMNDREPASTRPLPRPLASPLQLPRGLVMIPLSLNQTAAIVGGVVEEDDAAATVTAPPVLGGRLAGPGARFAAFTGEHEGR